LLDQDEVDEKTMMTPGNIVMMLNETSGIRVQNTSPSLGSSTVRIQGMKGRYTRFLADGLPIFGQQGSGLGLLQIPPVDLGRVEIIKGVASVLYGAGAMGGVVNLTTKRPGYKPARDFIVNQTTLGGTDVSGYLDGKLSAHTSGSLLGMGDWQIARDLNHDGWADVAGYHPVSFGRASFGTTARGIADCSPVVSPTKIERVARYRDRACPQPANRISSRFMVFARISVFRRRYSRRASTWLRCAARTPCVRR
jgi:iron complex outermembrane receptor protein